MFMITQDVFFAAFKSSQVNYEKSSFRSLQPIGAHYWTQASLSLYRKFQFSAVLIPPQPAMLRRSSVHWPGCCSTLRLPTRGLHSRQLPLQLADLTDYVSYFLSFEDSLISHAILERRPNENHSKNKCAQYSCI